MGAHSRPVRGRIDPETAVRAPVRTGNRRGGEYEIRKPFVDILCSLVPDILAYFDRPGTSNEPTEATCDGSNT